MNVSNHTDVVHHGDATRVTRGPLPTLPNRLIRGVTAALALVMASGCKDLTSDPGLPSGTQDPSYYNTADGAVGLRAGAIADLDAAIPRYLVESGLLSDELVDSYSGTTVSQSGYAVPDPIDERLLPEGTVATYLTDGTTSYSYLQKVRGAANIALGALAAYDTLAADRATQLHMRGELYAVQGYAEILLGELFCSGVPLTTLDFNKDFTYLPGSTASQVYADAKTKLDSAIVLATGDDSVLNMAKVLKGRALLELGNYRAAADDVSGVPTSFQYRVTILATVMGGVVQPGGSPNQPGTVADREGGNGLPFASGGDPRTEVFVTCPASNSKCGPNALTMPAKYFANLTGVGYAPFVVANGIEARLIEAEAALQADASGTQWLTILNTLRTTDGGVSGLIALADSGATLTGNAAGAARVAELFHERAYWLFATGHRQGDLRRLIRQYGQQFPQFRSDQQVYPAGVYSAPGAGRYGNDVTVPIPTAEYNNPNYHGCLDRNA